MMGATMVGKSSRGGKRMPVDRRAAAAAACPACGEGTRAGARSCQACGQPLAGGAWLDRQVLTVIGAACISLLALGLLFFSVLDTGALVDDRAATAAPSRTASSDAGQPPDLSTMTPREAADRLFNRVMMADEQGSRDEVAQFAPMAIAAYERVPDLDPDALYHVGLIHAAAGDIGRAKDAVQRLRALAPDHLLASALDHRLAQDEGDQARAEAAIERFKASYDREITIERLEYQHHRRSIDQFRGQIGMSADGDG
jgi:tetratricopeptide (TPR) repeat protein